jgi:hypothetical protein
VEVEEMITVVEVVVKKGIMRRMGNQTNKISVEEDAVVGEAANQIIPTSSATNVTNMVTMRRIITPISVTIVVRWSISRKNVESIKKWKRTNLVTEDEVKEGFLLMAHNEVNTDNNMVWYLNSGARNHMCGHKHLFKEMQKVEDGHVSFGDASKVEVKGQVTVCYLQKDGLVGSI